ncbi:MAG: rod shape-determining protein RodA [Tidjanibacter sp.]|nr:rod shape-determining protein RodA [Tidjanibacter sp.]
MTDKYSGINSKAGIDWTSVFIFIALMFIGWINIFATTCDLPFTSFEFGSKYCMQLLWMGLSLFVGMLILLSSDKYYYIYSYPAYVGALLLLILTLFVGRTVNGSRSWLSFGPVAIQTAELMKLAACLAVARYMSEYNFSLKRPRNVMVLCGLLLLPIMIILLQNDTGSAIVYCSFMFMLYREGVNGWIYILGFSIIGLFVLSFLLQPAVLLISLLVLYTIACGLIYGRWRQCAIYLAGTMFVTGILFFGSLLIFGTGLSFYHSLIGGSLLSLIVVGIYAYREKLQGLFLAMIAFVGSIIYMHLIEYVFNNILQTHQQKRILDLLGLESDLKGWGYNVHQSKIAIGSGGFTGKGFLQGTQTNYGFVPEQSTDFIFCTVGEEFGLWGTWLVVGLFGWLIIRLINMGERQQETFNRIYCYCAAGIILFHVVINIGMTLGLLPVIGIPLPLFSYGGSSLLVFTVMFFIAVKLDASGRIKSF